MWEKFIKFLRTGHHSGLMEREKIDIGQNFRFIIKYLD